MDRITQLKVSEDEYQRLYLAQRAENQRLKEENSRLKVKLKFISTELKNTSYAELLRGMGI